MGKRMETDQFAELMSAVARSLPRDMDVTTAQGWIMNQPALEKALRQALLPPAEQASGEPAEKQFLSSAVAAKYGYTVVEDLDEAQKFQMSEVEYVGFLEGSETYVNGKTMRKRAKKLKGYFSLVDGVYMLEHQDEIPEDMRDKYIVLAGTLLRGSDGGLDVACLDWDGSQWVLRFAWLERGWDDRGRLPRRK